MLLCDSDISCPINNTEFNN